LADARDDGTLPYLPYIDEFEAGDPPWIGFDGDYVLRGGRPDAWVLQSTLPVREQPPPIAFDLIAFGPERIDDPNLPVRPEAGLENAYLHHTDVLAPLGP